MSLKKASAYAAALAITTALAVSQASALTFASFGFTGGTRFSLNNDAFSASESGTFSLAAAVPQSPIFGPGPFSATLNLTGSLIPGQGSAVTLNSTPGTTSISQSLQSLSFSIIGTSGVTAGKNLLSGTLLTVTGANLQGNVNNSTNTSTASIGASGTNANISYTSDILNFLPGQRDLSFTLNNISPSLSVNGTTGPFTFGGQTFGTITVGDIQNFLADASANFGATPAPSGVGAVPEPGSFAMLFGMGVSGMAFGFRARRKK